MERWVRLVRNVPALGCCDDLMSLFTTYGEVEECKPMDAEDCEEFTDVFCLKFRLISNARFVKKKLDESVFLGNRLHVSYAPEFESLMTDTKDKLETRRKDVVSRTKLFPYYNMLHRWDNNMNLTTLYVNSPESLPSHRIGPGLEKLDKIQESGNQKRIIQRSSQNLQIEPDLKKTRVDNRRRI
ncbi:hypothetical protein N665_0626s0006 [Sinapis alba]|nr:hypothetical protein N665_0626s0006 [Sinapis alba]